ncbi:MFS transporter [Frankia sp. CH37]|nr:MFS transporter [Parafrankia sp. CH37]
MYAYAACEDAVLLYPLYALLFTEHGLSPAAVSSLFALWSLTAFLTEVPSGVLADLVSRRLLLVVSPLLSAAAFALWTLAPGYGTFAAGFVLWGVGGSLRSGTWQAHIHTELAVLGRAGAYPRLIGRAEAVGTVSALLCALAAGPVLAAGGFTAVGVASVAAPLMAAVVALTLPDTRVRPLPERDVAASGDTKEDVNEPGARQVLREGVAALRGAAPVRAAVVAVAGLAAVLSLDEYLPLLIADTGLALTAVPFGYGLILAGDAAGGWLADRGTEHPGRVLAGGGCALAVGAFSATPAGLVGVAVAFGVLRWAAVQADTRLQRETADSSRATVSSLAGSAAEVTSLASFGLWALGSAWAGPAVLFGCAALPVLVLAVTWRR